MSDPWAFLFVVVEEKKEEEIKLNTVWQIRSNSIQPSFNPSVNLLSRYREWIETEARAKQRELRHVGMWPGCPSREAEPHRSTRRGHKRARDYGSQSLRPICLLVAKRAAIDTLMCASMKLARELNLRPSPPPPQPPPPWNLRLSYAIKVCACSR